MKTVLWIIAAGGLGYLSLLGLVYFKQASLIYFPDSPGRQLEVTPQQLGLEFQDVSIQTSDDIKLHAWFVPAKGASQVVLFSHGNAGNISHRLESIRIFHELGLHVLIYDYRGYGQSEGHPSEHGTYLDVRAVWDHLIKHAGYAPEQIILFGRSLGGAMACHLASQVKPAAVIVESAFSSIPDMAASLYPFLPVRWISRFQYNNVKHIQSNTAPLLVIHSKGDEMIPWQQGRNIYDAAKEPKSWLELQGGHNDGFLLSKAGYITGIKNFLGR